MNDIVFSCPGEVGLDGIEGPETLASVFICRRCDAVFATPGDLRNHIVTTRHPEAVSDIAVFVEDAVEWVNEEDSMTRDLLNLLICDQTWSDNTTVKTAKIPENDERIIGNRVGIGLKDIERVEAAHDELDEDKLCLVCFSMATMTDVDLTEDDRDDDSSVWVEVPTDADRAVLHHPIMRRRFYGTCLGYVVGIVTAFMMLHSDYGNSAEAFLTSSDLDHVLVADGFSAQRFPPARSA